MKDTLAIIRRNFISPIVIAMLVLSAILIYLGDLNDAVFISSVIALNTLIAIIQEIRARRALKKLELLSAPRARRLIGGSVEEIRFELVGVGDQIILQIGDEVPADGKIIDSSGLEVNESILTGESASIEKKNRDTVFAASSVVAGQATMLVESVGNNTRAGKMTVALKQYKPQLTPMQKSIQLLITRLTYGALGLALIIFVLYSIAGRDAVTIFKTITTAAVTVVPEGLLLASTLLLAYGSIRLARAQVLPQKLAAIEAMALLNVLCVDKTGTLTSDEIKFEKLEIISKIDLPVNDLVGIAAGETNSGNATGQAIVEGVGGTDGRHKVVDKLSFSSERKMSGVRFRLGKDTHTVLIGASEILSKLAPIDVAQEKYIEKLASEGKRILMVAYFSDSKTDLRELKDKSGVALGLIILRNELRTGVERTVKYLQENNVSIRVISGDSPKTVQYVAERVGISDSDNILTGAQLAKINKRDWDKKVFQTSIFARILPEQKERLVETFMRLGCFTGMVGDGVNDALAIKKSNLGIAMYSGAAATRRVSDLVILNNSFNSLPMGMKLGNRIIQAIELIATLFFHKIIYGVILLFITLSVGLVYPFMPRHVTFMNIFLVTLPTLMWTLFPPSPRHRLSPKYFWRDTLFAVVPIAILSGLVIALTYVMLNSVIVSRPMDVSTLTVIVATLMGIYAVLLVPRMFGLRSTSRTRRARMLYVIAVLVFLTPSFGFEVAREFFDFTIPTLTGIILPLIAMIILVAILQLNIANEAGKRIEKRDFEIKS